MHYLHRTEKENHFMIILDNTHAGGADGKNTCQMVGKQITFRCDGSERMS